MYYTGVDPRNMKPVVITDNPHEKAMQRALIQYRKPENYDLVKEALLREGREDLIGFDKKTCLIPPRKFAEKPTSGKQTSENGKGRKQAAGKTQSSNRPSSKKPGSGNRTMTGKAGNTGNRNRKKK